MTNDQKPDRESIHFLAVGDISLGDHPVCFGHGIRSTIEKHGFPFLFKDVASTLSRSDILFGNLETVLPQENGGKRLHDIEMKGKSEYAAELSKIGFNVMSVANNHAMQHGQKAFDETITALKNNNIEPIGINDTGKSNCFSFEKNTVNLSIIGYSFRPEKYSKNNISYALGEENLLIEHIRQLKQNKSNVIVSIHWGEEYIHYPSADQVYFSKKIIDAGACLILGHHPHVLQGIEKYNGGVIVYSMGNFIFDMWQKQTRETMIFDCHIGENGIKRYSYVPIYVNKNYQPIILTGKDADKLCSKTERYTNAIYPMNSLLDTTKSMQAYKKTAAKAYLKYRIASYLYFIRNIYKYKFSVLIDSLIRFLKRRVNPEHT